MSLTVVATPIGHFDDITLRAVKTLMNCDILICEELKPARALLKHIGCENISQKELRTLNEHSKQEDILELLKLCAHKNVALISDCGTPGFCDPGADLVSECFKNKIPVDVNPGPSSLTTLISICGLKLKEFYFAGFLPAENSERAKKIQLLSKIKIPLILMDTPYRLNKTLHDLKSAFSGHACVLGLDLTGHGHSVERDSLKNLADKEWPKVPFVLIIKDA